MWNSKAVSNPFGVSVFGSAQTRVEPDHVSILFSVSRLEKTPSEAFDVAKKAAAEVQKFLSASNMREFGSSQIHLEQATEYDSRIQERVPVGYVASIKFNLILRDLMLIEEILSGIVNAGGDTINSVTFGTSQLKSLRRKMREEAVQEALIKAEVYAKAANVTLGKIIHIEDVNPDSQPAYRSSHGQQEALIEETANAFNPSSIVVKGAVLLAIEIA